MGSVSITPVVQHSSVGEKLDLQVFALLLLSSTVATQEHV